MCLFPKIAIFAVINSITMKKIFFFILLVLLILPVRAANAVEGTITAEFVPEGAMKDDMLQMLADFSKYMTANVEEINPELITFRGENTFGNNEQGVRHNADLGMICAFLVKYGKGKVSLPEGVTWDQLEDLARRSLRYSLSTHRANRQYPCKGDKYWGSASGSGQWESSLWAMSVAYSAFFQWEKLTPAEKAMVEALLVSECDYELGRDVPTGYLGDTKSEENGWEADVLAAALGLFPDHELAPKWFERLRDFAINSYSHPSDAFNRDVIDPEYDSKTVADLYRGANLYPDYTLQNHNFFHTSYQNVVMQELGEAALALKLFQNGLYGTEKWKTNSLMHNNQEVMDRVLNRLALADGELAMPNGNDWSLFLFDQITSYSTAACFLRDPNALMLENLAYKNIKARQTTTPDHSWLLRPDVGARRMGVEGHRVMMSWLMHDVMPTADLKPAEWTEFAAEYGKTKFFECQNIIASTTPSRFSTFSWSDGLPSTTGYLTSTDPGTNKIIVPFRANQTGNFLGWYTVEGCKTNARPVVPGIYRYDDNSWVMNGEINTNDSTLNNRFAIYSTPSNAVIYLDDVRANTDARITGARGGLMAISMDEFTDTIRPVIPEIEVRSINGLKHISSDWANVSNNVGFVTPGHKEMAFGDIANNNSIMTAKFYPLFSDATRTVAAGEEVDSRCVVYYVSVSSEKTRAMSNLTQRLNLPAGWNGVIAADPSGTFYALISNFRGAPTAEVSGVSVDGLAPVFNVPTSVRKNTSSATFTLAQNTSDGFPVIGCIRGDGVIAVSKADGSVEITNPGHKTLKVEYIPANGSSRRLSLAPGTTERVK